MPALVTCTSGTAAAELHPAVVEARYGRVPLIVITADRPSDLWETGAAQTIDQRGIYGSAPLWSHDLDVPSPGDIPAGFPAALAARLVAEALGGPGPVHLNLRFDEPLVPPPGGLRDPVGPVPAIDLGVAAPSSAAVAAVVHELAGKRGLLIVGPQHDPGVAGPAADAAAALGFPIFPDPQSGLLAGPHDLSLVMGAAAALVQIGMLDRLIPEVLLRIGAPPTGKPLTDWMAAHPEIPQTHIDDTGWRDPGATVHHAVRADPAEFLRLLATADPKPAPGEWMDSWQEADRRAVAAIRKQVAGQPFPTEPGIATVVADSLPAGSLLYVASSMPIRDIDLCFTPTARPIRIACNRGANGIDGFLSSGLGAAAVWGGPVVLLSGDLSALHDLTALATAARLRLPVTIVIVDNVGGGIFHFLPQAGFPEVFERHFGTPHGVDLAAASLALGVPATTVEKPEDLAAAVAAAPDGPRVLLIRTDRHANVGFHREIIDAVETALEEI
jgi:2-succinyl-5-enolpyruvyl-6-hydroxy-3-cyclohexene-1-carboxylate synthase